MEHLGRWNLGKHRHTPILVFPARVLRISCPRPTNLWQPHIAALRYLYICHRVGTLEDLRYLVFQVQTKILQLIRWTLETSLPIPSTARI